MSAAPFMRIQKLKGPGHIAVAARHNRREIQAELGAGGHIDPNRIHLNVTLHGPAAAGDVGQLARDLMAQAGVKKLRKDAVMGLEIVMSLPVGSRIDDSAYFTDCTTWAGAYFGGSQNILSADIHRDEGQPHCHILILPLIEGRMIGNKLMGGTASLKAMQKHFFDAVASRFGLRKAAARMSATAKQAAAALVVARLKETGDSALQSKVWAALRDAIERTPEPFLMALSITLGTKTKPPRTMAQIFTSKGKGKSKESNAIAFDERHNAIAFDPSQNGKGYVSVVFDQKHRSFVSTVSTLREHHDENATA
jgi:hypothetical protein